MKVISRVVAYRRQCAYCGSLIEFDRTDVHYDKHSPGRIIKCPECSEENNVSRGEFCHLYLLPCVTEIFEDIEKEKTNG